MHAIYIYNMHRRHITQRQYNLLSHRWRGHTCTWCSWWPLCSTSQRKLLLPINFSSSGDDGERGGIQIREMLQFTSSNTSKNGDAKAKQSGPGSLQQSWQYQFHIVYFFRQLPNIHICNGGLQTNLKLRGLTTTEFPSTELCSENLGRRIIIL